MKLSLRQKSFLSTGLMLLSIPLAWLCAVMNWMTVGVWIALAPLVAGGVLGMRWMRCPHCGRPIYTRHGFRPFCSECGQSIAWDEKQSWRK